MKPESHRQHERSDRRRIKSTQRMTLWGILRLRLRIIVSLASTSLAGGLLEAALLVLVTRAAFAVTSGEEEVSTFAGHSAALSTVLFVALAVVILRGLAAVAAVR